MAKKQQTQKIKNNPNANNYSTKKIVIENGVTSIGEYAYSNYKNLTSVVIPDSVEFIGTNAFYGCKSLQSITIPNVHEIEAGAFCKCDSLTSVTFLGEKPPIFLWDSDLKCGDSDGIPIVFENSENCKFYVPKEAVKTYKNDPCWKKFKKNIFPIEQKIEPLQSVFELEIIEYRDHYFYDDGDAKPLRFDLKNPFIEVNTSRIGVFSSLANAESVMKKYTKGWHKREKQKIFGFMIYEFRLDRKTYWMEKSSRSYLPNGSLLEECLTPQDTMNCDEVGESWEFFGRPADKVRFQPGDLVEVWGRDKVFLEIVSGTPPSLERANDVNLRMRSVLGRGLDHSDDCYLTYSLGKSPDDDTHSHPSAICLFPVRIPISKGIKERLEAKYNHFCK